MPEHDRVIQLLVEALNSGRTPEEVCAASPELRPAVRARWERCRRLGVELDDLFPPAGSSSGPGGGGGFGERDGSPRPRDRVEELPSVPGYEVESVLGRGGVGVVYRARHLRLKRPVALKMLLSGAYAGPHELARFRREAEAVASLRHPNVVQVYDVDDLGGRPYFTMEYLEGGSLTQRLAGTPLPARDAAALVEMLAGAVQAAHAAGIVHRDLKPANVLLAADGTPKVSDFGLARQAGDNDEVDGGLALTMTGARLGTPSYMAPEQAAGKVRAIGPAADVYALGAILYETLTGRPPFRGESAAETERQVIEQEPVPPRRLNAKSPRDLETICLKCLSKEPERRYGSAAALAADLGRFERGEPIAARPVGRVGRAAKWVRRRPAAAVSLAGGTFVALTLAGAALWLVADRAATVSAVAEHLDDAAAAHRRSAWVEADLALARAGERLGRGGPSHLRARLDRARGEAALVPQLDKLLAIRGADDLSDPKKITGADAGFALAFRDAGFGDETTDPAVVGARVFASDIRPALVGAIYQWMSATQGSRLARLRAVVRTADPDPSGWRDELFKDENRGNPATARRLLTDPSIESRSVELLLAIHQYVFGGAYSPHSLTFLTRVHRLHPTNYWVNIQMSKFALYADGPRVLDAVRYAQAAVVLRPEVSLSHQHLGLALSQANRWDEAIAAHREALRLDPSSLYSRVYLGTSLAGGGQHEEAIRQFELCLRARPNWEDWYSNHSITIRVYLGISLEAVGRTDEAIAYYREAVAGGPGREEPIGRLYTRAQTRLREALERQGQWDEMLAAWRAHLEAPAGPDDRAWEGYAEYCAFAGRADEFRHARRLLLDRADRTTDPRQWEVMARSCLLMPSTEEELRRATSLIDRALAVDAAKPTGFRAYFLATKALADYRAGRHEAAIAVMENDSATVLGPMPRLVAAMARARLGQTAEARLTLARAIASHDWSRGRATGYEPWIYHVLRREAEELILPNLPAYLEGRYVPSDNDERLAMAGACQARERHVAHARLWAEAFAADPSLAGRTGRMRAVVAAALAGCGQGKDAATLNEADRAHWRAQARQWVRLEIDTAASRADAQGGRAAQAQAQAEATLGTWSTSPDLAGVRDPSALARLPADEQREWTVLWERAASLPARVPK